MKYFLTYLKKVDWVLILIVLVMVFSLLLFIVDYYAIGNGSAGPLSINPDVIPASAANIQCS